MKQSKTLRRWELALLLGVALAALLGVWLDGAQAALSDQVIRLHVLANSDSEADQAPQAPGAGPNSGRGGGAVCSRSRPGGDRGAPPRPPVRPGRRRGGGGGGGGLFLSGDRLPWCTTTGSPPRPIPTSPSRQGVHRPAHRDRRGGGQNWWCVVFPPLCLGSVSEHAGNRPGGRADGEPGLP